MDNFFGIGTCSSAYDMRRHVNIFYALFIEARRISEGDGFMYQVVNILKSPGSEASKASQMKRLLTETEYNFLVYLASRYGITDSDLTTILSGRCWFDQSIRTPAGYYAADNWTLLTQMLYATALLPQHCQRNIRDIQLGPIKAWISNVRGINYQYNTLSTAAEGLNECLNKGWRLFTDLPKIEKHVIEKAKQTFGPF